MTSNLTPEEFEKKWMEAYRNRWNISELARELNLTRQAVSARALRLRAQNYDLPELIRSRSR